MNEGRQNERHKIQMAGNLWKIHVKPGDVIEEGQEVAILESMKMEIPIIADAAGTVKEVKNQKVISLMKERS